MPLSKQEREAFLRRIGAVVEARSATDGNQANSDSVSSLATWTDSDIEMAIAMGF